MIARKLYLESMLKETLAEFRRGMKNIARSSGKLNADISLKIREFSFYRRASNSRQLKGKRAQLETQTSMLRKTNLNSINTRLLPHPSSRQNRNRRILKFPATENAMKLDILSTKNSFAWLAKEIQESRARRTHDEHSHNGRTHESPKRQQVTRFPVDFDTNAAILRGKQFRALYLGEMLGSSTRTVLRKMAELKRGLLDWWNSFGRPRRTESGGSVHEQSQRELHRSFLQA